jgi:hypothetical protein
LASLIFQRLKPIAYVPPSSGKSKKKSNFLTSMDVDDVLQRF